MKWSEKGSEILSRAGGFPRPLFSSGRCPVGDTMWGHTEPSLWLGVFPRPLFFIRASPCGGHPQTPSQGVALLSSINPNPFFIRRGFEPLSKPLANPWQGDVIDYGQNPPSVKGFLYGSQSLCPFGASHGLFTSLLSPPLEKGLISLTTLYDRGYPQTPFSSGRCPVFFSKRTKRVCPFLRREEKN